MEQQKGDSWISTNDAICALLWQRISLARFGHPDATTTEAATHSTLCLAVNGRSKLDPALSPAYIGNVNLYAIPKAPLAELLSGDEKLGGLALSVRRAVKAIDDTKIRNTISFIEQLSDVSLLAPGFRNFFGPDLAITSWAELGLSTLDWGEAVGGQAVCVRIPKASFDGLCIILPKLQDGSFEVVIGLKVEHMQRLKEDEIFSSFARIV